MFALYHTLLVLGIQCAHSAEIVKLPGAPPINFKQYSGYFTVGEEKKHNLFYWFIESQQSLSKDALILWFSGGPGCSGVTSILTEWGPFTIGADGATLLNNPYSWNKNFSILVLDFPSGTGYSFSTDGNLLTDDDTTARENWQALVAFYTEFPNFRENDLYIVGESYAAVYIATLIEMIMKNQGVFPVKIKGFAIGNGFLSENLEVDTAIQFMHAHGMVDETKWQEVKKRCCHNDTDECAFHSFGGSDFCYDFVNTTTSEKWSGHVNPYNIASNCTTAYNAVTSARFQKEYKRVAGKDVVVNKFLSTVCINDTAVTMYLNRKDVRQAIHVAARIGTWSACSDELKYREQYRDMSSLIKRALDQGLKGMLYAGDQDLVCNFLLTEKFSRNLGYKQTASKREFFVDGELAGFHTQYENLSVVIVKGAGHMVPTDRPAAAYSIINSFVYNRSF